MVRAAPLASLAVAVALGPGAARAQTAESAPGPRGPIEVREQWLLTQGRLTLPATSPDLLPRGRTRLRLDLDWGNDFGWDQDKAGEEPKDRRFLVDGEHRTLALTVQRGFGSRFEAGVRVPLEWRGPGLLDEVIDWFHRFTRHLGLPDGGRSFFETGRLRVEGHDASGRPVVWTGGEGAGLGDIELEARLALGSRASEAWRMAIVARVGLPTGSGDFGGNGTAVGAQVLGARVLGRSTDLYLGLGGVVFADTSADGIEYERWRTHAFLAFEWRFAHAWSLLLQADGASRLLANLDRYPSFQSYLRIGAQWDAARRLTIEGGFTENIASQDATTDFGVFVGVKRTF
jgi:Protein of unknown function (DUF3187)